MLELTQRHYDKSLITQRRNGWLHSTPYGITVMKIYSILSALALSTAMALPAVAETAVTPIEKLVSELAEKPEHHAAIASYYKEKAATARTEAAEHKKMGSMAIGHSKSGMTQQNMRGHCEKISASLESLAKQYDELAKLHESATK